MGHACNWAEVFVLQNTCPTETSTGNNPGCGASSHSCPPTPSRAEVSTSTDKTVKVFLLLLLEDTGYLS